MTKHALTLAALATFLAVQAQAETAAVMVTDVDGNGAYSFEEVKAAYPDATEDAFKAADVNTDGVLSAEELKAAEDAKAFMLK